MLDVAHPYQQATDWHLRAADGWRSGLVSAGR